MSAVDPAAEEAPADARVRMDRMYRHQRHIYDLTRKYYLLGRDRAIGRLEVMPGDLVCEVGCGTARNLVALARRHRDARFFGLDASAAMLETANSSLARAGLTRRVTLRHGLAEELDGERDFGLAQPFDTIFFAYSISMIPTWREAIARAIVNLRPGGALAVVDFWDQRDLPRWFGKSLRAWLALFDVHPRFDLVEHFNALPEGRTQVAPILRGYAVSLEFRKKERA